MGEKVFVSRLEDLMVAEELDFEPTPGFGKYRIFLEHAIPHPAKMNTNLLEFLIKKYTKEGDTVLDPMAGTGSLGVIASLHGRNAIQVELEPKFYEWMEKARENVEKHPTFTPKGKIVNILGDARKLSELLNSVDAVITSPPYANTYLGGGDPEKRRERLIKAGHNPEDFLGGRVRNAVLKHYGEVNAIITSPPYASSLPNTGGPYGISLVYYSHPDNIGNLDNSEQDYGLLEKEKELNTLYAKLTRNGKPTYLSEMLKVYHEMYKVLKPNGLAIVVVKPYLRNKKIVDLPYYSYLLMERVGFMLEKLYKLKLRNMSFWRILYYKKYPDTPRIAHEYVIVCRKPGDT